MVQSYKIQNKVQKFYPKHVKIFNLSIILGIENGSDFGSGLIYYAFFI